jgi:hypothetical protein
MPGPISTADGILHEYDRFWITASGNRIIDSDHCRNKLFKLTQLTVHMVKSEYSSLLFPLNVIIEDYLPFHMNIVQILQKSVFFPPDSSNYKNYPHKQYM